MKGLFDEGLFWWRTLSVLTGPTVVWISPGQNQLSGSHFIHISVTLTFWILAALDFFRDWPSNTLRNSWSVVQAIAHISHESNSIRVLLKRFLLSQTIMKTLILFVFGLASSCSAICLYFLCVGLGYIEIVIFNAIDLKSMIFLLLLSDIFIYWMFSLLFYCLSSRQHLFHFDLAAESMDRYENEMVQLEMLGLFIESIFYRASLSMELEFNC